MFWQSNSLLSGSSRHLGIAVDVGTNVPMMLDAALFNQIFEGVGLLFFLKEQRH